MQQLENNCCIFAFNTLRIIRNMKHFLLLLISSFSGYYSFSRNTYPDSIKLYQEQYKADLYTIIKSDTGYIDFYPIDESMSVTANVEVLKDEKPFQLMTSSGKTKEAQKYAKLTFTISGKVYTLYAYQLIKLKETEPGAVHLFIPFTDETSGETSYGGGRYIDIDGNDIRDQKIRIDFNKAYNPYCAFTTGYNCPIPPKENNLPVAVKAGERYHAEKFIH